MKLKYWLAALFFVFLVSVLLAAPPAAVAGQNGPTFTLSKSVSAPDKFDLLISDGNETVISGSFTAKQMEVFRQVMLDARKFAMTEEEVGQPNAKTTRIASNSQPALMIDISKNPQQSQLYITYTTDIGSITIQAGRVTRPLRREDGLFFSLLSKIDSLLPPKPAGPKTE